MPESTKILLPLVAGLLGALHVHAAVPGADPMRPDTLRSVSFTQAAQYRVNAIIVSDERRIAIVNGNRVRVGDSINQATIIAITKGEVVIDVNGVEQTLRVNKGAGKK